MNFLEQMALLFYKFNFHVTTLMIFKFIVKHIRFQDLKLIKLFKC